MLQNISKIGKVLKTLNRLESVEFNATLPIKIEVKKQLSPIRYLIQLGKKETTTKSYTPLIVGKKYFAQIKEKQGTIQISNLKEIPEIFDKLDKIKVKEFKGSKEEILKNLSSSTTKTEFMFWTNILLAYKDKIFHLIIKEEKKSIMQFKYTKNRVKFYAVFTHLGEVEGEITTSYILIKSPYESTLSLIESYKKELNLEVILKKETPKELYKFSDSLLNLKA